MWYLLLFVYRIHFLFFLFFFFFNLKTAYERRISAWSSDVCSSDLVTAVPCLPAPAAASTAPRSPAAPTGASPCGSVRSLHPARLHCRGSSAAGSGRRACARNRRRQGTSAAVPASPWRRGTWT